MVHHLQNIAGLNRRYCSHGGDGQTLDKGGMQGSMQCHFIASELHVQAQHFKNRLINVL